MDIFFTALGIVLVVGMWPALVVYAWNDSMLRHPHGPLRERWARRSPRSGRRGRRSTRAFVPGHSV